MNKVRRFAALAVPALLACSVVAVAAPSSQAAQCGGSYDLVTREASAHVTVVCLSQQRTRFHGWVEDLHPHDERDAQVYYTRLNRSETLGVDTVEGKDRTTFDLTLELNFHPDDKVCVNAARAWHGNSRSKCA